VKDLSQPAANHQRLTLVFSFSELSAISFRRSGRMNARATDRGIIFFSSPLFLSSSFSCWSRNHNYIHLVLPPYLSILASIYLPPHHLATTLFFF
jgi:hypothetical protein